jgi:DnaJ-domain-containing protein 1
MSVTEAAAILFGLFAGYWAVSKLFFGSSSSNKPPGMTTNSNERAHQLRWHEILQVSPEASASEIRDAYRHLISKYHPDKVETLGQELRELAARRSQEITTAYRQGMQAHGEKP